MVIQSLILFKRKTPEKPGLPHKTGAGNRVRTGDLYLGKVSLYQLSYSRKFCRSTKDAYCSRESECVNKITNYSFNLGHAANRYWNMEINVNIAAIYNKTMPIS